MVLIEHPNYSECWQLYSRMIQYSPEIDASKFTLHIISDTPAGILIIKYILLMAALGVGGCRLIHDFPELAALETF